MAYRTLGELRAELAVRLGFGAMGSSGLNVSLLNSFLAGAQDQLYAQFDWRELLRADVSTMGVDQEFYDWPVDCDLDRLREIAVNDGARWIPLTEGITFGMRSDDNNGVPRFYERFQQLEVWPTPDAQYQLRLHYTAKPERFTQDNDRASIDDGLIFIHSLANAKAHYRQPDHEVYASQLTAMLNRLKARASGAAVFNRIADAGTPLMRPVDA